MLCNLSMVLSSLVVLDCAKYSSNFLIIIHVNIHFWRVAEVSGHGAKIISVIISKEISILTLPSAELGFKKL